SLPDPAQHPDRHRQRQRHHLHHIGRSIPPGHTQYDHHGHHRGPDHYSGEYPSPPSPPPTAHYPIVISRARLFTLVISLLCRHVSVQVADSATCWSPGGYP